MSVVDAHEDDLTCKSGRQLRRVPVEIVELLQAESQLLWVERERGERREVLLVPGGFAKMGEGRGP